MCEKINKFTAIAIFNAVRDIKMDTGRLMLMLMLMLIAATAPAGPGPRVAGKHAPPAHDK